MNCTLGTENGNAQHVVSVCVLVPERLMPLVWESGVLQRSRGPVSGCVPGCQVGAVLNTVFKHLCTLAGHDHTAVPGAATP